MNREEILNAVRAYYASVFAPKSFNREKDTVRYAGRVFDEKELVALVDSSLDFWLTEGRYAESFAEKISDFLEVENVILTNSGSSANLLALSALTSKKLGKKRLVPGDEVLTVAAGFPVTIAPILQNGLIPVFVDVELPAYNVNIEALKHAVSSRTRAVFLAHTLGNPFNVDEVLKIAKEHDLWLIEDNCVDGNRCSVVRIDGMIQVLTIKEIYNAFHRSRHRTFEILSHGEVFRESDIGAPCAEFLNTLSKRQLAILELYQKRGTDTKKIMAELGITAASYYCSMWEIRRKMRDFVGVRHKWSQIKDVVFKGIKDVMDVTQNFGQTSVTADHRMMVVENGRLGDVYAREFIKSDNVFVNILLPKNSGEESVDLSKYLAGYVQKNGHIKFDKDWIWFEYDKNCWKGKMSELPRIKREYKGGDLRILCALFGLYCSEGNCGHELRFSSTDYECIKLVAKYIKAISNLKTVRISAEDSRGHVKTIRGRAFKNKKVVFSANLGHELINILFSALGGTGSYDKRVPNFVFNLDGKNMRVFYDFYIKGDGCRKSENKMDFVITTASGKMASGVNLLNNLIFSRYSRIIISKKQYYDVAPVKSLKYIKKKINDVKIVKNAEVYDIAVDSTSTFVDACGNVLLHNCDALGSRYRRLKVTAHQSQVTSGNPHPSAFSLQPSAFGFQYTGTFGHIATLSFYPAHHITTGEGGAVVTNSGQLAQIIRSFRDWGRDCYCAGGENNTCGKRFSQQFGTLPAGYDHKYVYSELGYNLKMTDMQAAIGSAQMDKLEMFGEKRRANFNRYQKIFSRYADFFLLPEATPGSDPSWFTYILSVRENAPFTRNELVAFLNERRIETRNIFAGNMLRQPAFIDRPYRVQGKLSVTDFIMNNTFFLGTYPGMTESMFTYVEDCVAEFMGRF